MGTQLTGPPRSWYRTGPRPTWWRWRRCLVKLSGARSWPSVDRFYSLVDKVTQECVPTKLWRSSSRPLWMTPNILKMLSKKRRLWRAYTQEAYYGQDFRDFIAYKEVQTEIRKEFKKAKRKVERNLAKNARKTGKNNRKFHAYWRARQATELGWCRCWGRMDWWQMTRRWLASWIPSTPASSHVRTPPACRSQNFSTQARIPLKWSDNNTAPNRVRQIMAINTRSTIGQ